MEYLPLMDVHLSRAKSERFLERVTNLPCGDDVRPMADGRGVLELLDKNGWGVGVLR